MFHSLKSNSQHLNINFQAIVQMVSAPTQLFSPSVDFWRQESRANKTHCFADTEDLKYGIKLLHSWLVCWLGGRWAGWLVGCTMAGTLIGS